MTKTEIQDEFPNLKISSGNSIVDDFFAEFIPQFPSYSLEEHFDYYAEEIFILSPQVFRPSLPPRPSILFISLTPEPNISTFMPIV